MDWEKDRLVGGGGREGGATMKTAKQSRLVNWLAWLWIVGLCLVFIGMTCSGCNTLCWGPKHEGDPHKPVLMTNDDGLVTEVDIEEIIP
jgi:hypothetical protein